MLKLAPGSSSVALALHVAGRRAPLGLATINAKSSQGGVLWRMPDTTQEFVLLRPVFQREASVLMLTILAEGAIARSVTLSGGALFAS